MAKGQRQTFVGNLVREMVRTMARLRPHSALEASKDLPYTEGFECNVA